MSIAVRRDITRMLTTLGKIGRQAQGAQDWTPEQIETYKKCSTWCGEPDSAADPRDPRRGRHVTPASGAKDEVDDDAPRSGSISSADAVHWSQRQRAQSGRAQKRPAEGYQPRSASCRR